MWHPEECDNLDSCKEGQQHMYPDPGTRVEILAEYKWQVIGSGMTVLVPAGTYTIGKFIDHEGHQASIEVPNAGGPHDLVWVNLADLHAEGWHQLAPGITGWL